VQWVEPALVAEITYLTWTADNLLRHTVYVGRDRLAFYPFVVVRISCRVCTRSGSYRLARLAAKYGPEITLRGLTARFSYDCLWRAEARSKKGKSACGVYLPDLEHRRPPDLPPGMVKLRLVKGD
jgi:ATP-dependent DNA ligase